MHDLDRGELTRFDASFEMAQSWQRLIEGKNIQKHDLTLLGHELLESSLVSQGMTQDDTHILASQSYNYTGEAAKYYGKTKKNSKEQ